MTAGPVRVLLGPQRPTTNLGEAMDAAGFGSGRIAVISAAWQEAEGDIDDVRALIPGRECIDLGLYGRAEAVMNEDTTLQEAYRQRQRRLISLQQLYRLRLRQLMIAARKILQAEGDPEFLLPEQRHAVAQLRALDRHHVKRVRGLHADFAREFGPHNNGFLARHSAEMAETITSADAVLITGGNVVVLLNRLLLFGLTDALRQHPIVAWSAGAMVLAEHIVLFHDRTPLGRRDPELLGPGLGLVPGYVFLPDARHRIREKDLPRTSLFARRFSPQTCVTLDSGAVIEYRSGRIIGVTAAQRLTRNGGLAAVQLR